MGDLIPFTHVSRVAARRSGMKLNAWISNAISAAVAAEEPLREGREAERAEQTARDSPNPIPILPVESLK